MGFVGTQTRMSDEEVGKYMAMAYNLAAESPDPSTQNAALIVRLSYGIVGRACNTFPPGVTPRFERPAKYAYIEHAERGAIYSAQRNRYNTVATVMFCPWSACADCARAVVLSGIDTLVRHRRKTDIPNERWLASIADGDTILSEGGVEVIDWDGTLIGLTKGLVLLQDGKPFTP